MWGIPQRDQQVNRAQIKDQLRQEREAALRNDPARHLPTSVERGLLPTLLGLLQGRNPFKGDNTERRG